MKYQQQRRQQSSNIQCSPVRLFLLLIIAILLALLFFSFNKHSTSSDLVNESIIKQVVKNSIESISSNQENHGSLRNKGMDAAQKLVKKRKVAYAITVTKDGPFVDGALVLGYAARKVHDSRKGFESEFDVDLVAFVVPSVTKTRTVLAKFGWRIIERPLPVALDEIENKAYAEKMRDSGCCGADEFLKLWAYTLTEYERVIHLDMDSIVFQNMDELYEKNKEIIYTGDYNMKGRSPVAPAQGGFLVIRPSMKTFEEFRSIIRKGDWGSKGWGGSRIGNFWGGQTIQGIIPYYYHVLHPGEGEEANRCIYNCMVDNPYHKNTLRCIDGQPTCEDCRLQKPELVKSAHFTICQKPWTCTAHTNPRNAKLCKALHDKWFALRDEFEKELGLDLSYRAEKTPFKESMGMCAGWGDKRYKPIPIGV